MALRSTVFKASLSVADMDRGYYADHALTIAQHPSENDERMMVRVLAFALNASESLAFGQGMNTNDEADLWAKDLTGQIELWIDVGLPEPKLLKKAAARSQRVLLYAFGRAAPIWWEQNRADLLKLQNLEVRLVPTEASAALAGLAQRTMQLQCTVQDEVVWLSSEGGSVEVTLGRLKPVA